jgi:RHS repeat-associated protein
VLTSYYYDEEGVLYAFVRGATKYYVGADQVGSPRVVANASGTVVKRIDYDSFGSVLADSDPSFDLPIGFAGGPSDPITGLVRFGFRDYDPDAGKWTARDPLFFDAPAVNLYAYVDNNPLTFRDSNGLDWSWEGFTSGASAAWESGKAYVTENWHSLVDKVSSYFDVNENVKFAHEGLDKGLDLIDTANEVGDTYLDVQDALGEGSDPKQAAGLLKCSMKWLHKVLPVDWITQPATETLDRGLVDAERQGDTGTIHIGGDGRQSLSDIYQLEKN